MLWFRSAILTDLEILQWLWSILSVLNQLAFKGGRAWMSTGLTASYTTQPDHWWWFFWVCRGNERTTWSAGLWSWALWNGFTSLHWNCSTVLRTKDIKPLDANQHVTRRILRWKWDPRTYMEFRVELEDGYIISYRLPYSKDLDESTAIWLMNIHIYILYLSKLTKLVSRLQLYATT